MPDKPKERIIRINYVCARCGSPFSQELNTRFLMGTAEKPELAGGFPLVDGMTIHYSRCGLCDPKGASDPKVGVRLLELDDFMRKKGLPLLKTPTKTDVQG